MLKNRIIHRTLILIVLLTCLGERSYAEKATITQSFKLEKQKGEPKDDTASLSQKRHSNPTIIDEHETVSFSHPAGKYPEGFQLNLNHSDPDVSIIYTLDGSIPNINSLNETPYIYKNNYPENPGEALGEELESTKRSFTYTNPIPITDQSNQLGKLNQITTTWVMEENFFPENQIIKAIVVRAVAYKNNIPIGPVSTKTYFIDSERTRSDLTYLSFSIPENLLFGYEEGIYVPGQAFDEWRLENPEEEAQWQVPSNFNMRGEEWEYPASLELFETNGSLGFQQEVGIRIHGGYSRHMQSKSFRVYARNSYGESNINYPVFEDTSYKQYKRLLIRNSGQDWDRTLFRDAVVQQIAKSLNFETQEYRPSVLFINGEYWGIHNIRERYNKHYFQRKYNIAEENLEMVSNYQPSSEETTNGMQQLLYFVKNNDLSLAENYYTVRSLIDILSFTDYHITQIFIANKDWPHTNNDQWRVLQPSDDPNTQIADGKWRWLLYDTDISLGVWAEHDFDAFEHATNPHFENASLLLRRLLTNDEYRMFFLNRFTDLLNTVFLPKHTLGHITKAQEKIAPEINNHINRWNRPESYEKWADNVRKTKDFAKNRPLHIRSQLQEYFEMDELVYLNLDASNHLHGHIRINTIDINNSIGGIDEFPYPWSGRYFENTPIQISAHPAPGYRFSHWSGETNSTLEHIEVYASENAYYKAHFEPTFEPILLHYWHFNENIPNDQPLKTLASCYSVEEKGHIEYRSCLADYPYDELHPFWRKGSMERRNSPTPLNYRTEGNHHQLYEAERMRGIQVKPPFAFNNQESEIILHLPTLGAKDLLLSFAAKNDNAAHGFILDYATNNHEEWTTQGLGKTQFSLSSSYQLYQMDLSEMETTDNGVKFRIRILSENPQSFGEGSVVFNNFSLDGVVCMAHTIETQAFGPGEVYPFGNVGVYECGSRNFVIEPKYNHQIKGITLDGSCMLDKLTPIDQNRFELKLASPETNHQLNVNFALKKEFLNKKGILLYPNPASDYVNIATEESMKEVFLYNLQGNLIKYKKTDNNTANIHLNDLSSGIYIISVITQTQNFSEKIIIH